MHDHLPKPQEAIYADIEDMYVLEPSERYSFVRSFLEDGRQYDLPMLNHSEGVSCHYIRDLKTSEGHGTSEIPLKDEEIFQAGEHLFTRLKQCEIIEIDTIRYNPYLRVNLSECSVIVARREGQLWAAHLGMSQVSQFDHALEKLHEAGFKEGDCTVIASVGTVQEQNNKERFSPRLASVEEYIDRGFKPETVIPFEYLPPTMPNDRRYRNFCELTIGRDGLLVTTFDANMQFIGGLMQEKIHPETISERFIPA